MLFIRQLLPMRGKFLGLSMVPAHIAITYVSMRRQAAYCTKRAGFSREAQAKPLVARYGQAFSPSISAKPAPSRFNGAFPTRPSKEHMAGITSISYKGRQALCGQYTCTWYYRPAPRLATLRVPSYTAIKC